jgi:chaperonin cofactor prefoldin
MNIDERLEKLTQRDEALSQSVELLVRQSHETDRRLNKMTEFINQIAEGTARLLHVAEIHERRISKLEGGD